MQIMQSVAVCCTPRCAVDGSFHRFDLITLGKFCGISEGAKLRPAVAEAKLEYHGLQDDEIWMFHELHHNHDISM